MLGDELLRLDCNSSFDSDRAEDERESHDLGDIDDRDNSNKTTHTKHTHKKKTK